MSERGAVYVYFESDDAEDFFSHHNARRILQQRHANTLSCVCVTRADSLLRLVTCTGIARGRFP